MTKKGKIITFMAVGGITFLIPFSTGSKQDTDNLSALGSVTKQLSVGVSQSAQTFNVDPTTSYGATLEFSSPKKVKKTEESSSSSQTPIEVASSAPVVPEISSSQAPAEVASSAPVTPESSSSQETAPVVQLPVVTPPPVAPSVPDSSSSSSSSSSTGSIPYDPASVEPDLATLINRESGGNLNAVSGSGQHFGLGQLLDAHYVNYIGMHYSQVKDNADLQIKVMKLYIADRYGTVQAALAHSYQYNWY